MMANRFKLIVTLLLLSVADTRRAPMSRDKRSDDPPALEAVVNGHSQQLSQQTAELTALRTEVKQLRDKASLRVAFNAGIRFSETVHLHRYDLVKFDYVHFNEGSAYDSSTGIFTAPLSGIYVFLVSARSLDGSGSVYLHVDSASSAVYVDAAVTAMATGHFVYHMNKGAKAWVALNVDDGHLYSFSTAFSGFLVNPDM